MLAVQLEQRLDVLGALAAPAAVGGDAEVGRRSGGAATNRGLGADQAVLGVDQAEVELGLGPQVEHGQPSRSKPTSSLVAGHGQVDPVERAAEAGGERVGDVDQPAGVVGPVRGDAGRGRGRSGSRAGRRRAPGGPSRTSRSTTPARTSLNQLGRTPSSMANSKLVSHWMASWSWGMPSRMTPSSFEQSRLVDRLDAGLVLGRDERADRCERGGQRHLEADVARG